jgi:diguanylate cyclase (GGDEF)-like protein
MVYNEAAERLSLVDPLTDTFNRRYLDQIIAKDLSRAERQGIKLGFLIIDVDNFKSINTEFGHLTGDRMLVEVAQVLKQTFRASDIIIRFGGDEFLVMMSDSHEGSAEHATDRLTNQVARWNAARPIPGCTMALSWGFASYTKGDDLREVLNTADRRMYQHKSEAKTNTARA